MSIITLILASLVALEFFYILYLETIATTSAATARVFGMSQEELEQQSVITLFKNQGVYNGLIAVLVLIAAFVQPSPVWLGIFMVYIILVAAYGAVTSDPKILFKQGGLAMLTLLSLFF
ncbi:DUF1304 domain-containing protein [Streptococcus sanguinis]|uniref:DUF1304 domain-containing protein n=1 Tax=Streptococcus sanguinis TaxID=1305 RepID=UPI001374A339|nr:DUF1304 family protein [Streptococcus sanguinis]KAF1308570.1 hypothetical protein I925_05185 [Streptococcus sanguinis OH0843]